MFNIFQKVQAMFQPQKIIGVPPGYLAAKQEQPQRFIRGADLSADELDARIAAGELLAWRNDGRYQWYRTPDPELVADATDDDDLSAIDERILASEQDDLNAPESEDMRLIHAAEQGDTSAIYDLQARGYNVDDLLAAIDEGDDA